MAVRLHAHEEDRLASLRSYHVLDTPYEASFDALTRLAAGACLASVSLISLIDDARQWFLSRYGVDATEGPRAESVCSDVVAAGATLVVPNLSSVSRYADLPFVSGPPAFRAYAGVPLIGRDGLPLGTLCVLDDTARTFSSDQLAALTDLAQQVVTALELRRSDRSMGLSSPALVSEARQPVVLRRAVENHELVAHFQPQVDMRTKTILDLEALVRWQHPTRGLLSPAAFLPGLEVGSLGVWAGMSVLDDTCLLLKELNARDIALPDGVAVNVSGLELTTPGLARRVLGGLSRHDLPASILTVEITETAEIIDDQLAAGELSLLRTAGVRVVADDFGVGWSNLARLLQLPLDGLKIDRAFVTGLVGDPLREHMVASVIALAATMGLDVIAEGVETEEVRRRLLHLGCTRGQGWLFSKAVAASEVPALLQRMPAPPLQPAAYRMPPTGPAARGPAPGASGEAPATLQILTDSMRSLLRVDSAEQAVGVLIRAVSAFGGSTIPAARASASALPIDISLGEADPLLPVAAPGTPTRTTLERLLPGLVEDARTAADRAGRLAMLSDQVDTDPLTGLANRRALSRRRPPQPGDAVAMVDLDHFKAVNDTAGHEAGDRVLVAFSRALRQHLRATDLVYRFGGEEFLVVMTGTAAAGVLRALEHLRARWQAERPHLVTFSAGIATVDGTDLSAAVMAADAALYAAKEGGRDRFELAGGGSTRIPRPRRSTEPSLAPRAAR